MDAAKKIVSTGEFREQWKRLLSNKRVSKVFNSSIQPDSADSTRPSDARSQFERDYERVVFSSNFRRLAGKTQVRTFPDIDFIHNRLTHSMEVASVARTLGAEIGGFLLGKGDIEKNEVKNDIDSICWISQAAGIAHDLGNPPYGHSGEYAIRYWANNVQAPRRLFPENSVWKDFECFDGNAQAFRMLCTHDTRSVDAFSFTAASAGALVKYPVSVVDVEYGPAKFDVFSNAQCQFEAIWDELGLSVTKHQRHPLSYLSEAADDICYRVLDFEDAVISGVISPSRVIEIFRAYLNVHSENAANRDSLSQLRGKVIRNLVVEFVECFKANYDAIMAGSLNGDLRENLPNESKAKKFLNEIGDLYDELYTEHNKVVRECGAYSQIPIVLNRGYDFIHEVFLQKSHDGSDLLSFERMSHYAQHFVVLAWSKSYYESNRDKPFEWWMHILLDYVVGMTDSYINMLSEKLR